MTFPGEPLLEYDYWSPNKESKLLRILRKAEEAVRTYWTYMPCQNSKGSHSQSTSSGSPCSRPEINP